MPTSDFTESDLKALERQNVLFWQRLDEESDLGMVLSTGAYFENILHQCIRRYFLQDKVAENVLGAGGALGGFSALVDCNYLLRVIDGQQRKTLRKLARIRNIFAHQLDSSLEDKAIADRIADYSDSYLSPLVRGEMRKSEKMTTSRETFKFTSFALSMALTHREVDVWMHTLSYPELVPPHLEQEIQEEKQEWHPNSQSSPSWSSSKTSNS